MERKKTKQKITLRLFFRYFNIPKTPQFRKPKPSRIFPSKYTFRIQSLGQKTRYTAFIETKILRGKKDTYWWVHKHLNYYWYECKQPWYSTCGSYAICHSEGLHVSIAESQVSSALKPTCVKRGTINMNLALYFCYRALLYAWFLFYVTKYINWQQSYILGNNNVLIKS